MALRGRVGEFSLYIGVLNVFERLWVVEPGIAEWILLEMLLLEGTSIASFLDTLSDRFNESIPDAAAPREDGFVLARVAGASGACAGPVRPRLDVVPF